MSWWETGRGLGLWSLTKDLDTEQLHLWISTQLWDLKWAGYVRCYSRSFGSGSTVLILSCGSAPLHSELMWEPFPVAAQRSEPGVHLLRDRPGKQLYSLAECQVWRLVCCLQSQREAHQSLQDKGEPKRGPLHQEAPRRPASLPQHGPEQTLWVYPLLSHTSSKAQQEVGHRFLTPDKKDWDRSYFIFVYFHAKLYIEICLYHNNCINIPVKQWCVNNKRE